VLQGTGFECIVLSAIKEKQAQEAAHAASTRTEAGQLQEPTE